MAGAQDLKISVIQVLPKNDETKNENLRAINEEPQPPPLVQEIIGKDANYQSDQESFSYLNGFYYFAVLGICVVFTATQTLIPWHNLFINPEFWWEELIRQGLICMLLRIVLPMGREAYCVFQIKEIMSVQWHLKLYVAHVSEYATIFLLQYLIWTIVLENTWPMPMGGMIPAMIADKNE